MDIQRRLFKENTSAVTEYSQVRGAKEKINADRYEEAVATKTACSSISFFLPRITILVLIKINEEVKLAAITDIRFIRYATVPPIKVDDSCVFMKMFRIVCNG